MKNSLIIFTFLFLLLNLLTAQTVTGRVVNQNSEGMPGLSLQLYVNPDVYYSTSQSDGSFSFNNITDIGEPTLPTGYSISNNYPNPFNPKTRFEITVPAESNIRVEIYNVAGQRVGDVIKESFAKGTNYIDLELNELSNGVYLAHITIDETYKINKKLMLLYGSQHLDAGLNNGGTRLTKTMLDTVLDSIVVTGSNINRHVFYDLPNLTGSSIDVGNLTIVVGGMGEPCPGIPTITYAGKTYNTVQIGDQCWLRENLDVGTMIESNSGGFLQTDNGVIEKYCYDNDPANCETYGGLYEWPEAMQYSITEGVQGICPDGWHLPMLSEFQELEVYVNNKAAALIDESETLSYTPVTQNETGFSALFAGGRGRIGNFDSLGGITYFWSSSEGYSSSAYGMHLHYDRSGVRWYHGTKDNGFSVRCAQD